MFLPREAARARPAACVLITRPEPAAHGTAARVAALGLVPILAPMLMIRPLSHGALLAAGVQAVLLTSANALLGLSAALHGVPVLAVGDATADRARAAGFADVTSAGRDAEALAGLVLRRCTLGGGALLLPTARGEGLLLARRLREAGFAVRRRAVYVAVPQKVFPAAAGVALSRRMVGTALFFSPATARSFCRLLRAAMPAECLAAVDALVLSAAIAVPLACLPWRRIRVAARPDQDALLTLLADKIDE